MKKGTVRRIAVLIIVICFSLCTTTFTASAEIPYESYTYWEDISEDRKAVYNRPMYEAELTVSAQSLGISDFQNIRDICTDCNGNIYILDIASKIIVIDSNYKLLREIKLIGGESYNEASSLYIAENGDLYICDTEQHRIICSTQDGKLLGIIELPDSSLIPDDFEFRPTHIVIDEYGHMYVVSDGSYYGAILYDENGTFLGFFGANKVKTTISDVLTNIKNRLFPNNIKFSKTARSLPYCFVDIDIDSEGFVYTSTGFTSIDERYGQIKKLSPGRGTNILDSEMVNFVDTSINSAYNDGKMAKQDILSIEVDDNGFIFALESRFGKVYLYDKECRMITSFGGGMGEGDQQGTFVNARALTVNGENIIVCDSNTNLLTVFAPTPYGEQVKKLLVTTLNGDYAEAKFGWEEVLKSDNNFQPAYSGIARAYLNEGNYSQAMKYAREGYDRDTYSIAYEMSRQQLLSDNFGILFACILLVTVAAISLLFLKAKKKITFIKNKELRLMLTTPLHPVNNFTDIKEKKLGSVKLSIVLLIVYYIVTVLQVLKGGFLFTTYDVESFNSLWVLLRSVGLVALWTLSNWMVCTLLGGKGKLREIVIVTCYSLMPLIIYGLINIILTNILIPSEASFLGIFNTIAILYFLLMLIVGMLKIHDFSMLRFVGTSILSVAGIAAIVFLAFLVIILLQQLGGFIMTLFMELWTL